MTSTIRKRCWDRYLHTLRTAYRIRGVETQTLDNTIPAFVPEASPEKTCVTLLQGVRQRLESLNLAKTLLPEPQFRYISLRGRDVILPLCNTQAVEWYLDSPIEF
ncbi:MAG: hypothetical protein ACR2OA_20045 [Rubripirellula sp.]